MTLFWVWTVGWVISLFIMPDAFPELSDFGIALFCIFWPMLAFRALLILPIKLARWVRRLTETVIERFLPKDLERYGGD